MDGWMDGQRKRRGEKRGQLGRGEGKGNESEGEWQGLKEAFVHDYDDI